MTEGSIRGQAKEGAGLAVLPSRMALIELGALVAVILLEKFVEPFPDLSRMNPHPYWLFVLLLSLQYGTVSGLLAAIVSIVGSVFLGLPDADVGESYFEYLVRVWTQPVLWLITALLLGSFRMRQIEFRDDLLREVEDLQSRGVALVDHVKHLKARCEAMERELAASVEPEARRVLDAVGRLGRVHGEGIEGAFRGAVALAFPGAQASVYVAGPELWTLAFQHGWPDAVRYKTSFAANDPLIGAIGRDLTALSILSARDEPVLAGEGQFVVPIIRHDDGSVIGLLKIESLPAEQIGAATIGRLQLIAQQLASSLARNVRGTAKAAETEEAAAIEQAAPERGGFAAAIRLLPRIRWRSGEASRETASTAPGTSEPPTSGRSILRRT